MITKNKATIVLIFVAVLAFIKPIQFLISHFENPVTLLYFFGAVGLSFVTLGLPLILIWMIVSVLVSLFKRRKK
jgi:hypothetical protein